jgi:hypothetical protein
MAGMHPHTRLLLIEMQPWELFAQADFEPLSLVLCLLTITGMSHASSLDGDFCDVCRWSLAYGGWVSYLLTSQWWKRLCFGFDVLQSVTCGHYCLVMFPFPVRENNWCSSLGHVASLGLECGYSVDSIRIEPFIMKWAQCKMVLPNCRLVQGGVWSIITLQHFVLCFSVIELNQCSCYKTGNDKWLSTVLQPTFTALEVFFPLEFAFGLVFV